MTSILPGDLVELSYDEEFYTRSNAEKIRNDAGIGIVLCLETKTSPSETWTVASVMWSGPCNVRNRVGDYNLVWLKRL